MIKNSLKNFSSIYLTFFAITPCFSDQEDKISYLRDINIEVRQSKTYLLKTTQVNHKDLINAADSRLNSKNDANEKKLNVTEMISRLKN